MKYLNTVGFILLIWMLVGNEALSKKNFFKATNTYAQRITTATSKPLQVNLSFDESEVNELNLKLKWSVTGGSGSLNRFALTSATKSAFGYSYNSPNFISREIKNPGTYLSNRFIDYKSITETNENDCAKKCFYADKYYRNFECTLYHFSEIFDDCTLFQYDRSRMVYNSLAYEVFADICLTPFEDYDESHSLSINHCKEIIDYTDSTIVPILPSTQYKFTLEVRDSITGWGGVVSKEYIFTPKLTFKVDGDLRVGQKVNITCEINLIPSLIDSINWIDKPSTDKRKAILTIDSLSYAHHNRNYTCEAKYYLNTGIFYNKPTLSKSYMLRLDDANSFTPVSTVETTVVERDLTVHLTINYDLTINRLVVLSSINNSRNYSLVKKYSPFTNTEYDNTRLYGSVGKANASDPYECALQCLMNPLCNHYVYTARTRNSYYSLSANCMLSSDKPNQNRIFACLYNEVCQNVVPYQEFFNSKTLSIKVLPNTQYNFTLNVYNDIYKWSKIESKLVKIPLTIAIKKKGSTTLEENASNTFALTCVTNVDKNTGKIKWLRNNEEIKINDNLFNITEDYTANNNLASSYLNFNLNIKNVSFDGTYTCLFNTTNTDVGPESTFYSDEIDLEFAYKQKYFYNITNQNFTFSTMTGAFVKVPCVVQGYPYPKIRWEKDGVEIKQAIDGTVFDKDAFVMVLNEPKNHQLNYVLGISLDKIINFTKIKCILEPNTSAIVLREHTINIIDNSPKIDVKIDQTSLDELKLSFNLSVKGSYENIKFRKYDENPVKYRIRFSRRNQFIIDDNYYDAPNILLNDNLTNITNSTSVFSIGTLVASNNIRSCKMACLYNPYCKYYDFYVLFRKCLLFSFDKWMLSYRNLANELLRSNNNETSDLIVTLLLDNHLILVSDLSEHTETLNEVVVESCENVKIMSIIKDTVCMGEIQEYRNPYVFENLLPDTEYNFTFEGINGFGKIKSEIQTVYIPFPLNDITESEELNTNTKNYSLKCSTSLKKSDKLSFKWFKNGHELNTSEHYTISTNDASNFSSILQFNSPNKNISGIYTCTLFYNSTEYENAKSTDFTVLFKYGPHYEIKDSKISLNKSDTRNESCVADGYPLPRLQWFFNNQSLNNSLQNLKTMDHTNYHFRVVNELIITNATGENNGNYTCVLNDKIVIKTLSLTVLDSKNEDHKANSSTPVWISVGILCSVLLIVLIGTLILKREKIRSAFTSLNLRRPHLFSYNRMEDEAQIMDSPVDNTE